MHRPGFWISIGNISWITSTSCSSLMCCFRAFQFPPCPHTQELDWFLCWAYERAHCRKVFTAGAHPMTRHHRSSGNWMWKRQMFSRNLYREVFPLYKNCVYDLTLDVNVAAVLQIWPGHTYHTWWWEAALSDVRSWAGHGIYQTRTATLSPLSIVSVPLQVWCISSGLACRKTRSQ